MPDKKKPHPEMGINLRKALELCGICGTEYPAGMVMMGMQNYKYICPFCGLVHYGEPELGEDKMYECPRCHDKAIAWEMIELQPNEPVKNGVGCCSGCRDRLGESRVAFIEIVDGSEHERTGNVYFAEPPEELEKALAESKSRCVFVEASWCAKTKLDGKEEHENDDKKHGL